MGGLLGLLLLYLPIPFNLLLRKCSRFSCREWSSWDAGVILTLIFTQNKCTRAPALSCSLGGLGRWLPENTVVHDNHLIPRSAATTTILLLLLKQLSASSCFGEVMVVWLIWHCVGDVKTVCTLIVQSCCHIHCRYLELYWLVLLVISGDHEDIWWLVKWGYISNLEGFFTLSINLFILSNAIPLPMKYVLQIIWWFHLVKSLRHYFGWLLDLHGEVEVVLCRWPSSLALISRLISLILGGDGHKWVYPIRISQRWNRFYLPLKR